MGDIDKACNHVCKLYDTIEQQAARIAELESSNAQLADRCRYLESLFPATLIRPLEQYGE